MKLMSFSVTNYRSITNAHKIKLGDYTVLVGKNNEGKSNVLKALIIAINYLIMHSRQMSQGYYNRQRYDESIYNWERDFPTSLQYNDKKTDTIFKMNFKLAENEIRDFRTLFNISTNSELPVEIKVGKDNIPKISIKKKGSSSFNNYSKEITQYTSESISLNYIPAIRTGDTAIQVIRDVISEELRFLENDDNYKNAQLIVNEMQQKLLNEIADKIKEPLHVFLPSISEVKIEIMNDKRIYKLRNDISVLVNDGVLTRLDYKGDGVKSLAALALLKTYSSKSTPIIAIEEPEAHLHPEAMHQINEVLRNLAQTNQVIITTHNPVFIVRDEIRSNVIIKGSKAEPAKNIKEIRETLGIRTSDNLTNAEIILVVEGADDRVMLSKLLPNMSEILSKSLKNGKLAIQEIGGAGNLSYRLSVLKNELNRFHVLLDNDEAGRKSFEKAQAEGLISEANATFSICNGMPDSEFEDYINKKVYCEIIEKEFGVDLNKSEFRGNKKWSDRLRDLFLSQGKRWTESIEKRVKMVVANSLSGLPDEDLISQKRSSLDALISSLEALSTQI